ncbi:MAG: ABC transporter permease [Chitinophagia bacterium]|jgi:ABC-2 type transport system permease protein
MKFLNIVYIELYKIFRKPRTYISFAAVSAIVGLIQLGFYADGESYMQFGMQSFTDSFDIQGNIMNGYLMAYIILQLLLVHVPLLVALVAGDMISGEAAQGTLRVLLTKPIRRSTLILAKFTASGIYTLALLLWMAVWALGISMLVFGVDDMLILKSESASQIMASDVMWRYMAAFLFAAIALLTVSALSFFLSLFAENSIGPIMATMSIIIVFTILNTLDLPIFSSLKPFLFTSHMLGWKGFFDVTVNANNEQVVGSIENLRAVIYSAGILILHIAGFLVASILIFRKKDIMS